MKRDSFVMFTDDLDILDALPDEQAAKLMRVIRDYMKGIEPDLSDPVVNVAFFPIKKHLDDNYEKWCATKEERSKSGKLGAEARWGKKDVEKKPDMAKMANAINDMANIANAKNDMAKMANDSKAWQSMAKMAVNVNDNVNVNVNDNENEINNYQLIADMYNDTCVSFPKVTKLSDNRRKAIRARLKKYSLDEIKKVFELAEQSDFLKGNNNRNWSANFDWLMNDNNMAKVLDGNYNNKERQYKVIKGPPENRVNWDAIV